MALNYAEFLDKIIDNANVGKVVTDVGSGFALSISIAMLLGLWTNISILPADRSKELAQEKSQIELRLQKEKEELRPLLIEAVQIKAEISNPKSKVSTGLNPRIQNLNSISPDMLYLLARREIADLNARIETLKAQLDDAIKISSGSEVQLKTLLNDLRHRLVGFASLHDRLLVQKNAVDEENQKLVALRHQGENALSFSANAQTFTDNLITILPISVIFGVILSQISRLLFVILLFDKARKWLLKRQPVKPTITAYIKAQKVTQEEYDALITNYYRYVEGAINMIAPVLLFGFAFPAYANSKLGVPHPISPITFGTLAVIVALLLLISGFFSYDRFRQKEQELCEASESVVSDDSTDSPTESISIHRQG